MLIDTLVDKAHTRPGRNGCMMLDGYCDYAGIPQDQFVNGKLCLETLAATLWDDELSQWQLLMVLLALPNINKKFHKEQGNMNILHRKWPGNDWFNPSVEHKVFYMRWKSCQDDDEILESTIRSPWLQFPKLASSEQTAAASNSVAVEGGVGLEVFPKSSLCQGSGISECVQWVCFIILGFRKRVPDLRLYRVNKQGH